MFSIFANLFFLTLAGLLLKYIIKRNRRDKNTPHYEKTEEEKEIEREITREKTRSTPPMRGG